MRNDILKDGKTLNYYDDIFILIDYKKCVKYYIKYINS